MTRLRPAAFAALSAILLTACDAGQPPAAPAEPAATATTPPATSTAVATATATVAAPPITDPQANDGIPDLTPAPLTPAAERTAAGATNILISWARALELQEFDQAWALLSPADQDRWPKPLWRAQFAGLSDIMVAFDGGAMEGAAGSSYYRAPIRITAQDREGRPVRYTGEGVLRRVNDVPGSSAAQRRWHFERLTLDWTH